MRRAAALLLFLLLTPAAAGAGPRTIVFPTLLGEYQLTFDDRRLSEASAAMLRRLGELRTPAELEPVLAWLRSSLSFSLWLEQTKLDFYASRDAAVLGRQYQAAEPARGCGSALTAIRGAAARQAQDDLVALDWHNCMNSLGRRDIGEYPLAAWQRFLATWGVTEKSIEALPVKTAP